MIEARAVVITKPGAPEVLEIQPRTIRDPGPGEVRIAVAAAGLNRADCIQRRGFYPAPPGAPADIPGLEYAGTIERVGEGVALEVGTPVMGITGGGGMCTHLLAHEREVIAVPTGTSLEQAAAIPEAFMTAYDAMLLQSELVRGEVVLIHAVASGVGTAGLQLAAAIGATAVGTSRSAEKLGRCAELGLRHAIDTSGGAFASALKDAFPRGADVIVDVIGASYAAENLAAVASTGRIITLGLLGGMKAEVDLGLVLRKRVTWRGSVLRARPLEEKGVLAQRFARELVPLFESGALRPIVDEVMPMEKIVDAHRRMEANETFGKLVLRW